MKAQAAAAAALALLVSACARAPERMVAPRTAQDQFWARLSALCGQAFGGQLVEGSENARANFGGKALVMHVRECSERTIHIPFHVGEDRSRTWIVTRSETGLRLKHDHRHQDGRPDPITLYGGDTANEGSAGAQDFPADAESKAMFAAHVAEQPGLAGAENNLWTLEIEPGASFVYQLRRTHEPGRRFRVAFDLTRPVEAPPPAWGWE